MTEIKWYIGKEGTNTTRMDIPPYRSFFIFFVGEEFVGFEDYGEAELRAKVEVMEEKGEDVGPFAGALSALSDANSRS